MRNIWQSLKALYSGPFQSTLVFSFTMVAALTIALGSWVISKTITAYLADAMDERVAQDIQCAKTFYLMRQQGLRHSANQLSLSNTLLESFAAAEAGDLQALDRVNSKLLTVLGDASMQGNRTAALLDRNGRVVTGLVIDEEIKARTILPGADWSNFDPVAAALGNGEILSATEVILSLIHI